MTDDQCDVLPLWKREHRFPNHVCAPDNWMFGDGPAQHCETASMFLGCRPKPTFTPIAPMRLDLLEELATILDRAHDDRFDYRVAFRADANDDALQAGSCGTVACALGYATLIPETGLRLRRVGSLAQVEKKSRQGGEARTRTSWMTMLDDAASAFGIGWCQAEALFSPDLGYRYGGWIDEGGYMQDGSHLPGPSEDATPREVATWIRTLVPIFRREGAAR